MITLLNSPVITAEGLFRFRRVSLEEARALVSGQEVRSAIGHEITAKLVAQRLSIDCPMERIKIRQEAGERALVFHLSARPDKTSELSLEEIERIGYEWGLLERLE